VKRDYAKARFGAALAVGLALSMPVVANAFDPVLEIKNFAKIN